MLSALWSSKNFKTELESVKGQSLDLAGKSCPISSTPCTAEVFRNELSENRLVAYWMKIQVG